MCGIAGIYKLDSSFVELTDLKRFTDSMNHRGPDGSGYELLHNNKIGFGHRRLSILDLSELGKQPMYFENRYCITYNGEVFNFLEIRQELTALGYNFATETDTEVIIASYKVWGKDAFLKFNGMWAFAIWDEVEKTILICRDRFGVKPLHYIYKPGVFFAFASETIAFKSLNGFNRTINEDRFLFAITNPSALEPTGKTVFEGIEQLLPGHYIEFKNNNVFEIKRWWNTFDHLPKVSNSPENQIREFFEIFKDACKIRLRSDVTIASALSGGLDSSSVFGMIHHISKTDKSFIRLPDNWKKAVIATFPGTEVDEKHYADQVVNFLKADAIYTQPDYLNLTTQIEKTTQLFDSISGTPIISVSDVYKAMRSNGITVSMDGHGGDEILFGYKSSINQLFQYYLNTQKFDKAKEIAEVYSYMGNAASAEKTRGKLFQLIHQLQNKKFIYKLKDRLIKPKINSVLDSPKIVNLDSWFNKGSIGYLSPRVIDEQLKNVFSYEESILVKDFLVEHLPYNLRDFDRGAMQNGIEIRMPLMDYRLVCYSFALPTEAKVGNGYTKLVLRNAMKDLLPETIRLRKNKIGLGAPTAHWFNNQLGTYICDEVSSDSFLQSKYWSGNAVKEFVHKTTKNKEWNVGSANKFWNILNAHILIKK
jgi:asparagine synthase (glutamine-hydrolysing)